MSSHAVAGRVPAISLQQVHAGYGRKEILRGLTLDVHAGEILALIGANGAGKSTVLKVAVGLLRAWEGRILLHGEDVTRLSVPERVRRGVGFMLQGGEVFPSLTVRENLDVGLMLIPASRGAESLERVVSLFPVLAEKRDVRAGLLSGGQRQSLALGMVLVQEPRALLLDEPTAGLSPGLAQDVLNKVKELNAASKLPIMIVEQRTREVLSIADRALWLAGGQVAHSTEAPSAWLEPGVLERLQFAA